MPKQSTKIKVLTNRDLKLFKQLANTGIASKQQVKANCGIDRKRLSKLQNSGYIKIECTAPFGGKLIDVVRLDNKGRSYCEYTLGQEYFYNSNLNQANHDLKLTEAYYRVINEHPTATWRNETELMITHKDKFPNGDCVDAVVEVNGGSYAIEVVGHKYTKETIENKVANGNAIANKTILI